MLYYCLVVYFIFLIIDNKSVIILCQDENYHDDSSIVLKVTNQSGYPIELFYIEVDPETLENIKATSIVEIQNDSYELFNSHSGHKFSITLTAYVDQSLVNNLHSDVTFFKSSSDEVVEVLYDSTTSKLYIRQYDSYLERNNEYDNESEFGNDHDNEFEEL